MSISKRVIINSIIFLFLCGQVVASDEGMSSYHYGLFHPNGLDIFGYSVEEKISDKIYKFYTFGFPSAAAIGINYYGNYSGNGFTATASVAAGTLFNVAAAYQFHVSGNNYFKLGAGFTSNIAYNGVYSVISYEQRMKR